MAWLNGSFRGGLLVNLALASALFAVFCAEDVRLDVALRNVQYFNGWVLVGCIAVLMVLTVRKRMIILPLGRVRFWLLAHYYIGFVTVGVFLVHSRFRLPNSALEWLLEILFVLVAVSGLFGAVIEKYIPPRLEAHGERILFERIPVFRNQLATEAETLARDSVQDGNTESMSKLYVNVLGGFFAGPRNFLAHLQSSRVPAARLFSELHSIERYQDQAGKLRVARMRELVDAKNNLDFHYANGGLLRFWLFVHIPATYAMLVAAALHVVLAYTF